MSKATPALQKQGSGSFKEKAPPQMNLGVNLGEEDWAYAAGVAAQELEAEGGQGGDGEFDIDPDDLMNILGPSSTRSQRASPKKKKGRMFSPRTTDLAVGAGARGGGGGSTKASMQMPAFTFDSGVGL